LGELAADGDGFLDGGQGVLASAQFGQAQRLVVQRRGEVREEGVGAGLGELAADGDGFLDGGQGVLASAQFGKEYRLVVQRRGEVREDSRRALFLL
jgi:hypothetical protein